MKKYIYILALFLFAPMVQSADFCDSLHQYRYQIKRKLNYDTTTAVLAPDITLNQFVREAVIKVSPMIKSLKLVYSDTLRFKVGTYSLDTAVVNITDVSWSKNDSMKTFLYLERSQWFDTLIDKNILGKSGYDKRPSFYDYIDNQLFLFPIPVVSGDTIKITAVRKLPSMIAVDSLSIIPQKYRVAILEYATYLTAKSLQHSLTESIKQDFNESVAFLRGGDIVQPTK